MTIAWAVYNLRKGRSDRAGARTLALTVAALHGIVLVLAVERIPHPLHDPTLLAFESIVIAIVAVAFTWVGYVGLEPFVRRHWPRTLVAWTRLLRGGVADSRVGRELLFGIAAGALAQLFFALDRLMPPRFAVVQTQDLLLRLSTAIDLRSLLSVFALRPAQAIREGVQILLLFLLLRMLLRREWLASIVFVTLLALIAGVEGGVHAPLSIATLGLPIAVTSLLLLRQGFLAFVACGFTGGLLGSAPLTTRAEAWYADSGYAIVAVVAALALGAYLAATRPAAAR
jgi:serine/threonine-protein kinase